MSPALPFLASRLSLLASFCLLPLLAAPRIDLNPDVNRSDVLTTNWDNWTIKEGTSSTFTSGSLTFTLSCSDKGQTLSAGWWKAGYDTNATLGSDGAHPKDKGGLTLTINGLSPGKHRINTFHNGLSDKPLSSLKVVSNNQVLVSGFQPASRTPLDPDLSCASFEVDAREGEPLVLELLPEGNGELDRVVLNALEIDEPNPALLASLPKPFDGDEHALSSSVLFWRGAKGSIAHKVYFGTDRNAVSIATPESPEFKGNFGVSSIKTGALDPFTTYYWRVDEVAPDKSITKGRTWSFRPATLAFPGAEGYGRHALGGRGGRVLEVTNLNDSGPGSLRAAVEAEGPRTVVFRVGGTIHLKDKLIIKNPYLTIAGQTAPGDGISIYGFTLGGYSTHDLIVRYLRIRVGDTSGKTMDGAGLGNCDHSIFDHCSIAWSIDEGFSSRGSRNITFQRSIVAEALNMSVHSHYVGTGKGHSFAGSISGEVGSFHHNLVAHCSGRNWSLAGGLTKGGKFAGYLDIRNNVVYNWGHRTNDGGVKALNLVGNLYIPGPASRVDHLLMPDLGGLQDPQTYFVQGNEMEGRPEYTQDNWSNGAVKFPASELKKLGIDEERARNLVRLTKPFCNSFVTTHTAREAYANVLADVGANFPRHDEVDLRVLNDVKNRSFTAKGGKTGLPGIIDSQKDVGGYKDLKGGEAPADSDHDGLPDTWEASHGLDPQNPADGPQPSKTAPTYTNLEVYLNTLPSTK